MQRYLYFAENKSISKPFFTVASVFFALLHEEGFVGIVDEVVEQGVAVHCPRKAAQDTRLRVGTYPLGYRFDDVMCSLITSG